MSIQNKTYKERLCALLLSAALVGTLNVAPAIAYAQQSGSGQTDIYLNIKAQERFVHDVLRDIDGNVIINDNPLTVVKNNGDGTGSVWKDDGTGNLVDTGIDVFVDDNGVPYTDPDGNIWPKEDVKTDYSGNPILDENGNISVKDGVDPNDKLDGELTKVTDIGDGKVVDKNGDVYKDGEKTGEKVPVDSDGNPITDSDGNVYKDDDINKDSNGNPILDDNGYATPKDGKEPIGHTKPTNYGDASENINFTVPTKINFTSDSKGNLTGPDKEDTYIENLSVFPVNVQYMKFTNNPLFNIVDNAQSSSSTNAVDLKVGPEGNELNVKNYLTKNSVPKTSAWDMTASQENGSGDCVFLNTDGHINNISNDVKTGVKIGTANWYIAYGNN